jgi:hypothetical protein
MRRRLLALAAAIALALPLSAALGVQAASANTHIPARHGCCRPVP